MNPNKKAQSYRFSGFEFDPQASELLKLGSKINLQGQPLDILAMLLERAGETVTRQELQKKLWPADTFVDFEHSLNAAVKRLREALNDSADAPRFIETLPRRGYRFIGPLEGKPDAPAQEGTPRRSGWHWIAYSGIALVVLIGVALGMNLRGWRDLVLQGSAVPRIRSIAVLPLENLSGNPEQEYFADGMTDLLIADLAQIGALRVISRTSIMRYKDTKKSLPEIAQELNVDAVVEGTVLRSEGRVRIIARLVYVPTDAQLWAETYDRDLGEVLKMQGELAQAIADGVHAELTPHEQARLAAARPVNPQAYEAYLKGLFFLEKLTEEGITKGIECLRQATDIDPTYAPAYSGLADGYNRAAIHGYHPAKEAYPTAKAAVSRALRLDDALTEAHVLLGVIKFRFDWDWAGAERDLKRALQLNTGSSRARLGYGTYLLAMGRVEEAITEARRALELDPLTVQRHIDLAWKLSHARRHDEAITRLGKALELAPDSALAYGMLATNYAAKGMYVEARAMCERALNLTPDSIVMSDCGRVYVLAGRRGPALKVLERMLAQRYVSPYQVALLYDALGYRKQAFQGLVQAYEARAPEMCFLKIDTFSAELRSDPRFQDLLRRMNFPK